MISKFPPVEYADEESGLLVVGGDLEIESLRLAYSSGIFPWPVSDTEPILWFAPNPRAILNFDKFKIPRRLQRDLKNVSFTFKFNTNFEEVILNCAFSDTRKNQQNTWITDEIILGYINFHNAGFAKSFEAYNEKGELVGGMYGVMMGNLFAGESMFFKESNASKFVLIKTVKFLQAKGCSWMDIQTMTPLLEKFGAEELPREEFMEKLEIALEKK